MGDAGPSSAVARLGFMGNIDFFLISLLFKNVFELLSKEHTSRS